MFVGSADEALPLAEYQRRARAISTVLVDNDGTLTDGTVLYSAKGEELKRYSLRDGMGVERLRAAGIETVIVTREQSGIVAARASKLGVKLHGGVFDKGAFVAELGVAGLACIGDDVNDLPMFERIGPTGLTGAPSDALPVVRAAAHYRAGLPGGQGAFRDFAEWLLSLR